MSFHFGIDRLLTSKQLLTELRSKRVGLVGHPASMTRGLVHSLDALVESGIPVVKAFGPQHGMRGDKQDNMIESDDYMDPIHNIPVVSLYGDHRKPTKAMLEGLDVILFDLQDVGCRIYTYITTLHYFVEMCGKHDLELWVLDRPNPAGREVDGLTLESGQESFVGADVLPTRHGLTVGELANWFNEKNQFGAEINVVRMQDYDPVNPWAEEISWVNPSPNAASINMARCFPGTVLLEGTTLSEGRGTTTPLEVIGAPELPVEEMLNLIEAEAPHWLQGATLRTCFFEPTFHKHVHVMCSGIQIHTDNHLYQPGLFHPYRLIAGLLKALRTLQPEYEIWRYHEYEYELDRTPIDVINGGPGLRNFVDDPSQTFSDFENRLNADASLWKEQRKNFLLY